MIKYCRQVVLATGICLSAFLVGCAGVAPNYLPSIDNVETLKKAASGSALKVGVFDIAPNMSGGNSLALRAASMSSSVGANYGDYLAAALRQELELAKLYNPRAATEVSGTLLKNSLNAGGVSTADGQMEARFVVTNGGQVKFDKVKRAERQWESSFAGAVAVPLAANNYPLIVQALIAALLGDPDFGKALRGD